MTLLGSTKKNKNMKYLSDYMKEKQNKLFKDNKCFFAFSIKQMEDSLFKTQQSKKDIVSLGSGMYCPRENAKFVVNQLDKIYKQSIKQDLKENGKEGVIYRELCNHECFYISDYTECVDKLIDYPITNKEIENVYFKHYQREISKF